MKHRFGLSVLACTSIVAIAAFSLAGGRVAKTTVHGIGWFNSFEDAKQEAKRTGKPILFLSMFGKLDEPMPCANARTLRATLFKDPEFKKLVTDEVIPAWEMVRAVPHITIDFGDGKKITRTARGNACMYLCNPDGKVVDAYPGIYTAKDFIPMVEESVKDLTKANADDVIAWHGKRGNFVRAVPSTLSKMAVESPTLNVMGARPSATITPPKATGDPRRDLFLRAARGVSDMSLNPMSPDQIAEFATGEPIAGRSPADVGQLILKADSQQNVNRMRAVIHLWLASEKTLLTPAEARDTVLETILKIPYKDPYFGLKEIEVPGTPN
ncbi:MAG: hypothetical protein BGO01_06420 [Armatimonadetes bacterium 55-13]|nr:hypothetical protein [Armatimonadota bacterium]OJU65113.1 MAG: hypothetical protein BGO01_06420 [Armatimonadetes bacterium 55-13]